MSITSEQNEDWEIVQGETFPFEIDYQDPDGNPIDLTGLNIIMEVRDKPAGRILCATCTLTDGITVDNLNGKIFIELTPAKTKKFTYPRAAYQIEATDSTGQVINILKGWFKVEAGTVY